MTTYNTPHFATGQSDLRSEPPRTRPASAATYRTAGVSNEAAAMRDVGQRPDWQPGAAKGVPKAAIGAVGAALVGGIALAVVLMAPSNKVTKVIQPDPIAQAKAENDAAQKSVASTDAAVNELEKNAPAAGDAASQAALAAQAASAVPAPVQNVVPDAPPVVNAPVAHVPRHVTQRVAPQPVAPAAAKTEAPAPVVTPPADVQPPAMQQTPDTPTVTPSEPAPAPATTPDTPAQAPAQ